MFYTVVQIMGFSSLEGGGDGGGVAAVFVFWLKNWGHRFAVVFVVTELSILSQNICLFQTLTRCFLCLNLTRH